MLAIYPDAPVMLLTYFVVQYFTLSLAIASLSSF